jgi:hypothetical protein
MNLRNQRQNSRNAGKSEKNEKCSKIFFEPGKLPHWQGKHSPFSAHSIHHRPLIIPSPHSPREIPYALTSEKPYQNINNPSQQSSFPCWQSYHPLKIHQTDQDRSWQVFFI